MSANEKIFLNELAILLRLKLAKFSSSPEVISKLINCLIYVPAEGLSFSDFAQSADKMCSKVTSALQEKEMVISLIGVELDKELQPVFTLYIEIFDEDLKLDLTYDFVIGKSVCRANKSLFEFDTKISKSYVWEKLTTKIKGYQIFGSLKKS